MIARLHILFIESILPVFSLNQIYSHGVIQEFKISLNHIFGDMRSKDRYVRIGSEATQELQSEVVRRDESVNEAITEHVHSNPVVQDV